MWEYFIGCYPTSLAGILVRGRELFFPREDEPSLYIKI
jgi:hypothetical protein